MKLPISAKIRAFLVRIPLLVTRRPSISILCLVVVALIIGAAAFYKYAFLAQKIQLKSAAPSFILKEDAYNKVLNYWQEQDTRFKEAGLKDYSNPFNPFSAGTNSPKK